MNINRGDENRFERLFGNVPDKSRLLLNILFGLIAGAVFFLLLEIGLFWLGLPNNTLQKLGNPFDPERGFVALDTTEVDLLAGTVLYNIQSNPLTAIDQDILFRVRPNLSGGPVAGHFDINSNGFRGALFDPAHRGLRILFLGDSCAFGWQIAHYADTIAGRLNKKLASENIQAQVINLGQPGHSSTQGRRLFDAWKAKIKPDLVILYFGWNDIWPTPLLTDTASIRLFQLRNSTSVRWLEKSRTYQSLDQLVTSIRNIAHFSAAPNISQDTYETIIRVPHQESLDNFKAMISGTPAVVIPPPFSSSGPESLKRILPFNLQVAEMEWTSKTARQYYNSDGFHPNKAGSELMAEALFQEVIERLPKKNDHMP